MKKRLDYPVNKEYKKEEWTGKKEDEIFALLYVSNFLKIPVIILLIIFK